MLSGALALLGGCSDEPRQAETTSAQGLTSDHALVLGFERPTLDWSSSATIAESTTVSQGAKALAVQPNGWTEINSVALSSLGSVKSTLSVDVRVPSRPSWGELRVILIAPSLGWYWNDLGGSSLAQLSPNAYGTLTFPLPASVENALEGNYSDLRLKLVVNGPSLGGPYLLDNVQLVEAASPNPAPTPAPSDSGRGDFAHCSAA
jgi:hypothetical protein